MRQFMEQCRVVLGWLAESFRLGHIHRIGAWLVVRAILAMLNGGALGHRRHYRFTLRDRLKGMRNAIQRRINPFTLLDVEHVVVAQDETLAGLDFARLRIDALD